MLVNIVWKVLGVVFPRWGTTKLLLLGISFVVGVLIYWISQTDHMTAKEKGISAGIAFFNCFFLAASALGIDVVSKGTMSGS
jgi:hypothetical protein